MLEVLKGDPTDCELPPDLPSREYRPLPPIELVHEIVSQWPDRWQALWRLKAADYRAGGIAGPEDEQRAALDTFAVMQQQPGVPWRKDPADP